MRNNQGATTQGYRACDDVRPPSTENNFIPSTGRTPTHGTPRDVVDIYSKIIKKLAASYRRGSRAALFPQKPTNYTSQSSRDGGSEALSAWSGPRADGRHDAGRHMKTRDRPRVDVRLWYRRVSPKSPALHRRRKTPFYVGREPARAGT